MHDSEFDAQLLAADLNLSAVPALVRQLSSAERERAAARWGEETARLSRHEKLTGPQEHRFERGLALLDASAQITEEDRAARRAQVFAALDGGGGVRFEGEGCGLGAPAQTWPTATRAGVFGDAHRAIEGAARSGLLPDYAAERATGLVEHGGERDRTLAARWAAAAAAPAYLRAFAAAVTDPQRGHLRWSAEEQEAYRVAESVREELRAMSLTDSAGGFMVPLMLDPAIMLSNAGTVSPLRARARVVTTVTDSWSGVTSAGVTSEWLAEAAEAAAVTPGLAQPTIPVHKLSTYVEYSLEVGMDAVGFLHELQALMLDSAGQTMDTAYTVGSGAGQPKGLITALDGTASEVAPTTAETFAAADVYKVQNALGPRFQPNASWLANLAIINQCAQFETAGGALKFPEVGDGRLLRRPLDELSVMDGTINPAVTADNHVLVYGDLRAGLVIVDRIGATFETVQHVLGANRRPTGQRGAWLYLRTGSDVVVPEALRMLNVATTA